MCRLNIYWCNALYYQTRFKNPIKVAIFWETECVIKPTPHCHDISTPDLSIESWAYAESIHSTTSLDLAKCWRDEFCV